VVGFRRHLPQRAVIVLLGLPSLAGGIVGAVLLLHTPERLFEGIAPGLVLLATVLLAVQEPLSGLLGQRSLVGEPTTGFATAAVASVAGGLWGAALAQRLGRRLVRHVVIAIGVAASVSLGLKFLG